MASTAASDNSLVSFLHGMAAELESRPLLNFADLDFKQTVLVIMDMINGFTYQGPLASPRVQALVPEIVRLATICRTEGIRMIAFADAHDEDSSEFSVYPPHSIRGTWQSQVVQEIADIGGYTLIEKNSTNGFHEPRFQEWLKNNEEMKNWIVVGNCTDICVYQYATTMVTYSNTHGRDYRVMVPMNAVDTFDSHQHFADLYHLVFLQSMINNGIEVYSRIT